MHMEEEESSGHPRGVLLRQEAPQRTTTAQLGVAVHLGSAPVAKTCVNGSHGPFGVARIQWPNKEKV